MDFMIGSAHRVAGEVAVPGDKAISHRALIIGAITEQPLRLRNVSSAADVDSTARALVELSARGQSQPKVDVQYDGYEVSITQNLAAALASGGKWTIDCGNSGSTMRMLMGLLASFAEVDLTLVGDESLSRRPMERIAVPIRAMGARIELAGESRPPVHLRGARLSGIEYRMPVASAQLKTAVLLAGLRASGSTILTEPAQSRDHTERLLAFLGAETRDGPCRYRVEATNLLGDKEIDIPGDFSSASFLLTAAAIVPGSDLETLNTGLNPTRTAFLDLLRAYGAEISLSAVTEVSGEPRGRIRIRPGQARALNITADLVPQVIDELPLVAVLATTARGTTEVRGAAELRVKESDRIAAIVAGLGAMGAAIRELPDGLVVEGPRRLKGAVVDSKGDHRIAMALAVAGLIADGETTVRGWECVDVSFPGFGEVLRSVARPRGR